MRYADMQHSAAMCADWILDFSEVFELTHEQTESLTKEICDLLQLRLEEFQWENANE